MVGENMEHPYRINGIQWTGIMLGIIGAFFIAFPTVVGIIAIKFITFLLMIIGFYSFTFSLVIRSTVTTVISITMLLLSIYAFLNPNYILLIIGIACIINGGNGLMMYRKRRSENLILSSILMVLLGVFAIVNSKAALATVMMILGIVILAFGIILIYQGKLMKPLTKRFFYSYNGPSSEPVKPQNANRVVINIDTDEVEEVDFKDV